jgi:choline dehydrogenase-like flavoprotein
MYLDVNRIMENSYDVVIIGAGFGGSVAAKPIDNMVV